MDRGDRTEFAICLSSAGFLVSGLNSSEVCTLVIRHTRHRHG